MTTSGRREEREGVVMPVVVHIGGGSSCCAGADAETGVPTDRRWSVPKPREGGSGGQRGRDSGRALSGLRTIRERRSSSHRHVLASHPRSRSKLGYSLVKQFDAKYSRALPCRHTALSLSLSSPVVVCTTSRALFASLGISLSAADAKHRANVDARLSIAVLLKIYDVQGGPDTRRLSFRIYRATWRIWSRSICRRTRDGRSLFSCRARVFVLFNIELSGN